MAREIVLEKIGPVTRAELSKSSERLSAGDLGGYMDEQKRLEGLLWDAHKEIVKAGQLASGFLLTFPRGDGKAIYRVERLKPLQVQHVPLGDCWRVEDALIRGLTLKDVYDAFLRAQGMVKLFGRG